MRLAFVLAMRVASYWCVAGLKPVQASVVNGVPLSAPSIFSSTKSPSNSGRIVDVPLVARPGAPGRNQNVISTSHVPHIAARRAYSGPVGGAAPAVVAVTIALRAASAAIRQARRRYMGRQLLDSRRTYLVQQPRCKVAEQYGDRDRSCFRRVHAVTAACSTRPERFARLTVLNRT